jgi:hypothetical protein
MQCACACTREIFFFGGCVGLRERVEKLAAATRLHRRPDVEWQRQLQRHSPAAKKKYSRALSSHIQPADSHPAWVLCRMHICRFRCLSVDSYGGCRRERSPYFPPRSAQTVPTHFGKTIKKGVCAGTFTMKKRGDSHDQFHPQYADSPAGDSLGSRHRRLRWGPVHQR